MKTISSREANNTVRSSVVNRHVSYNNNNNHDEYSLHKNTSTSTSTYYEHPSRRESSIVYEQAYEYEYYDHLSIGTATVYEYRYIHPFPPLEYEYEYEYGIKGKSGPEFGVRIKEVDARRGRGHRRRRALVRRGASRRAGDTAGFAKSKRVLSKGGTVNVGAVAVIALAAAVVASQASRAVSVVGRHAISSVVLGGGRCRWKLRRMLLLLLLRKGVLQGQGRDRSNAGGAARVAVGTVRGANDEFALPLPLPPLCHPADVRRSLIVTCPTTTTTTTTRAAPQMPTLHKIPSKPTRLK
eukprot:CAMPEP_0168309950 /NCGR_PEP_ID=MMETSP0142_2-20121227/66561_1 /TAXON_ID=44445 /ORGANISM="Pseudo-nitzschia australis, Strain 10249 10 AB" /LENGTH=296 /DNA_ID=CAMNT_0008262725 /DNA_START=496 /DNA_END=1386 /DNA_ORIENTATION=-